jgi:hypothetical protein
MNKTFTLYWLDGKREFVTGPDIAKACTLAGYSNGAMRALDWYDTGASETDIYIKSEGEESRWVRRGPVNLHRDDVAGWPHDEFIRLFKTSSEIRIELRNKDRIMARLCYGQFATVGWVKYIEVFYAEQVVGGDEDEPAFNVHTPVYFDPNDFENAVAHLRARVSAALIMSKSAINVGSITGAKSLDEIKASQDTIPL